MHTTMYRRVRPIQLWLCKGLHFKNFWILFGCMILCNSCTRTPAPDQNTGLPPDGLARVGETIITEAIFRHELERRAQRAPERYASPEARQKLLEEMIRFEVLYQKALSEGFDQDEVIRQKIKRLVVTGFEAKQLAALETTTITPQEIEQRYLDQPERFGTPARSQVALIRISCPRTADDERRTAIRRRAEQALSEIAKDPINPGWFGRIAQDYSDHQASRYRGGDVGWLTVGSTTASWPTAVMDAVGRLTIPGAISPILEAEDGFYLVKILEHEPANIRPLDEVRDGIVYHLTREREAERVQSVYDTAQIDLPVQIDHDRLQNIQLEIPQQTPPTFPGGVVAQKTH